jgi:small-conductance mechanosensitive channel
LSSDQVASHLGETADWFHHLGALQVAGADSTSKDRLHQQTLTAVELAVDFGRACARLLSEQSRQTAASASPAAPAAAAGATKGFGGRLDQAAADIDQHITTLQAQIEGLDQQIARVRGKERETLIAQKGQASAALELAREVRESVQNMEEFEASSIAGDAGNLSPIEGKIADIERSIPELRNRARRSGASHVARTEQGSPTDAAGQASSSGANQKSAGGAGDNGSSGGTSGGSSSASPAANGSAGTSNNSRLAATDALRVESAGVIALITEWFSLSDSRRQLSGATKETDALQDEIEKIRTALVNEVRDVVGKDLAISTSTDPAQLAAQRAAVEQDTSRFKQLSTVLVPLGEQALVVESARNTLDDWRTALNTRMAAVARYLALRIGIVLGWIAVVLVISEIWRRATFRYLHDQRRRRQFLVLRRVAVGIALTFVIVFGLVSEIGSLATYIGFVTAGVAVALQNVILAVVAYFFFIGRYGVRVGDRVTLSGVTGRVVEIGLVRVYLMELAGPDLHATGRMVVLSNAVLFQPTAMFKQIPGADYVWHTVTLTIAATADVVEAHKRLKAASDEVYEKYRDSIERQHAVMQQFIDFDAPSPRPEIRVRLTENGLECSVRYPIMLENAAVIDQQMLKALRDALEHDSQFKLVGTGAVVLKSSEA